jgi:hypothetical protein
VDRVTVSEAARILGIKEESVRKRVSRGKLRADKDEDGRLLVYLDRTQTVRDEYTDESVTDRDELVDELRDRVRSLERRLDDEGESRRRADTIIAQLTQANAALTERLRELEAPQTNEEAAQDAAEAVARVPATQGASEAAGGDTEPRWMRNKVLNWLMPQLLGYALPILFSVLGAIYVSIRAINDQAVAAVLGTIISVLAVGLSLSFYWRLRRQQRQAEAHARWMQHHAERLQRYLDDDTDQLGRLGEFVRELKDDAGTIDEALDKISAELDRREAWFEERLREEPELGQRLEELVDEYRRERPPES